MNNYELEYRKLLVSIKRDGSLKENRTGVDTISCFNKSLNINLAEGFPILTAKRMFPNKAYHEYVWMIQGLTTTAYLNRHGIKWWNEFADERGELGKTYGYQIRNFNGEVDQLEYLHREIQNNSRRAHMTLWNPSELAETILPPCYTGFTFMRVDKVLHMSMQLRSSDVFLGLPYDICVAAFMLKSIANFNDLIAGELGVQITDAHVYTNHKDQVDTYLSRSPSNFLPKIHNLDQHGVYSFEDYKPKPLIKATLNN